jgi:hypothetical protein
VIELIFLPASQRIPASGSFAQWLALTRLSIHEQCIIAAICMNADAQALVIHSNSLLLTQKTGL